MNLNNLFIIKWLILVFCFLLFSCIDTEVKEIEKDNKTQTVIKAPLIVNFPVVQNLSAYPNTEFLPTLEQPLNKAKNGIYAATLLYCWNEIKKEVGKPIVIGKSFKDLTMLNLSNSHLDVLKPSEYTTSITVDKIKKSIIVKAEFSKSLFLDESLINLKNALKFDNINIDSFGISQTHNSNKEILKSFTIVYYLDYENFVIKLNPKNKEHEIILFKSSFDITTTMSNKIIELNEKILLGKKEILDENNNWKYTFNTGDLLVIPKFKFNIEYDFPSFTGNTFNASGVEYGISKVIQRNAFILNQNGAEVESVASIGIDSKYHGNEKPLSLPQKFMKFDKPFILVLKRTDQMMPYFAMWVGNSELMQKEE